MLFTSCKSNKREGDAAMFDQNNIDVSQTVTAKAPFSRGVNFSAWFETGSAQSINFTKYIEQDFIDAKSLGVDVIRLPVRMHSMTGGAPDYTIDPFLFRFLDMAVNWAEKHELYLIIDNHSFDPILHTPTDIDKILIPVWTQVAQRYKNQSSFIIYEILNEPHGISDSRWGEIQGMTIDAIRAIDPERILIVGGTDYNSIGKLSAIPHYQDKNLIYTFHFYDPYLFTHQGAGWGSPSLESLANLPFPYDRSRMPNVPADLRNTWVAGALGSEYQRSASPQTLYAALDKAAAFSIERDVPIFCGEFGVYIPNSQNEDRVKWYRFVTDALNNRGIAWTIWDYYGGFGIFNTGAGNFNHDLNTDIVRALGFNPPNQTPRRQEPLRAGMTIYDDFPNRQFVTTSYWGNADFSLYDVNAAEGEFTIHWKNARQYDTFSFDFIRNEDFNRLVSGGFFLEFKAKVSNPVRIDVRFVNPENLNSTPWRMRYSIDDQILPADGRWHTIRIPLSQMHEHGAWINARQQWLNPRGEFLWSNVTSLQFVAEHSNMEGISLWFDEIKITE